jgi:amidohydrolase
LAISLGELKGGYAPNIISDFCQVTGTVRTVTNADRDLVLARIKSIGDTHATLFKASVTFTQFPGLRIVTNDRKLEKPVRKALSKAGSLVEPGPSLRSEDFYNFSEARPSTYFAIGAALPGAYEDGTAVFPSHTSTYQIDEGSLLVGVKAWLNILNDW